MHSIPSKIPFPLRMAPPIPLNYIPLTSPTSLDSTFYIPVLNPSQSRIIKPIPPATIYPNRGSDSRQCPIEFLEQVLTNLGGLGRK